MKKIYSLIAISLISLFALFLASCKKSESGVPEQKAGTYAFVMPCLDWKADDVAIRKYMASLGSEWVEFKDPANPESVRFYSTSTGARVLYDFKYSVLSSIEVLYYTNVEYKLMLSDWSEALNLKWSPLEVFGRQYDNAECASKSCTMSASKGSTDKFGYMTLIITHVSNL